MPKNGRKKNLKHVSKKTSESTPKVPLPPNIKLTPLKPSTSTDKSEIKIDLSNKENIDPKISESSKTPKLLELDNFKDWIDTLKQENFQDVSKDQMLLVEQNLSEVESNVKQITSHLKLNLKFDLKEFIRDSAKLIKLFPDLELTPDFYSKGPLKLEYITNRILNLSLFKSAKSEFELLLAYSMFSISNSILSIQEQLILDKVGNELTFNLIKDSENAILATKEELKHMTKFDSSEIEKRLTLHEDYIKVLEDEIDQYLTEDANKIKGLEEKFEKMNGLQTNYDELKLHINDKLKEHEKSLEKSFGLIRKLNGRCQGLYDQISGTNKDPPDENLGTSGAKEKKINESTGVENFEEEEDELNEDEEEEEENESDDYSDQI